MTLSRRAGMALLPLIALSLSGCISTGSKPPPSLLNLTATQQTAAGSESSGTAATALAVLDIAAPQKLDVLRVPVVTGGSSLAYLQDAQWVEKPSQLFERVLADTLRARGNHLLVSGTDLQFSASSRLSGTLDAMDYDASRSAAVVRFDAVLVTKDGRVQTRRFEAVVDGVSPKAEPVGAALNEAANKVAADVANWVG
ncbi:ABC transporter [Altererythrobacter salegens]|uniref:ABC transporter n=1 Tax=Croceibacterium salegens TaxID=1737568 RepID=A0A6I4SQA4_9SPHN|nr:ABC-type transport auxiliary lipoprotein family protein [Croceibacterium salegens]MXO58111.1 ABC transporter [Croceibacterium salegens]